MFLVLVLLLKKVRPSQSFIAYWKTSAGLEWNAKDFNPQSIHTAAPVNLDQSKQVVLQSQINKLFNNRFKRSIGSS